MKIFEIIKIALSSIRMNKLRSGLTILGIVVGIFSIISISTIIAVIQNSIEEGVAALGKNTFQLQKWPSVQIGNNAVYRNRKNLTMEEYKKLKNKLEGKALYVAAEQWSGGKRLQYGNKETNPNVSVCGCTIGAFPNNGWFIAEGRGFSKHDVDRGARYIILGSDITKLLFPFSDPLGKEVKLDGKKFKVLGTLESQGEVFGRSQDNYAVMPITTWQSLYGNRRSVNITIQSFNRESYQDLMEITEGYFRTIRKVSPGEPNNFEIQSNENTLAQINDMTAGIRIGAFVIATIALLAAGVGIMNIMLVSVTERTREIGIRKSIGAKRNNILFQFLSEAITLSLLGGIIGIFLGVIVGNIIGSMMNATAVIPLDSIFIGVFTCIFIGVLFGTYPAYKAANLDPIDALRFE
jgi:putative ABC transport system permease protein